MKKFIPFGKEHILANAKIKDKNKLSKLLVDLDLRTQALTKKDLRDWRNAWQLAIDVERPDRRRLYEIYTDVDIDMHLTGCVGQRRGFVKKKSFKLVDRSGKEQPEATELFEAEWFKDLIDHILSSRFWGHSLIELGSVVKSPTGKLTFDRVELIPRQHVCPEKGLILKNPDDELNKGFSYRSESLSRFLIEAGKPKDLGLYLKCATQTIPKKNQLAFWDQFGEIFGMPVRIAKTTSRDPKERSNIEKMLDEMGAAAWGLFPEGTEIEIKETSRGDAFNVYDKRIARANTELSKGILMQTMTLDDGSSLSQSEVHLEVFKNVIIEDADYVRDIVNWQLIPRMQNFGFPLSNLRFDWDETIDYTPEQQVAFETMLLDRFEIAPKYFIDKYNIPILKRNEEATLSFNHQKPFFD